MDLVVVGIRQRLEICVPVRLMFANVIPEPSKENLLPAFRVAIGLGVLGCRRQLLALKETTKYGEELADKLWTIVYQHKCCNAIRHDPMV